MFRLKQQVTPASCKQKYVTRNTKLTTVLLKQKVYTL